MNTSDLRQVCLQAVNKSRGLVLFDKSHHNIFMATHAAMYRYLPISKESAVSVAVYGAGAIFIIRSRQVGYTFTCFFIFFHLTNLLKNGGTPFGAKYGRTKSLTGKELSLTCVGWQVTLCDPIWHVMSRSSLRRTSDEKPYALLTSFALTLLLWQLFCC